MISPPEISVITVCKNAGAALECTIQSVLGQRDVRLEYIVIDGGSTDATAEVLGRYRDQIAFSVSEPDAGIYDAMNKGLSHATGELIFFLNANDLFFNEHVAAQAVATCRAEKADFLFGDIMFCDDAGEVRHSYRELDLASFFERPLCHQGVFATRRAFQLCGNFDPAFRLAGDFDWILKALRRARLRARYLPFVVSFFDGRGLTGNPTAATDQLCRSEMQRALETYFNPFERFVYKVARRCRLTGNRSAWDVLASIMRWKLRP